MSTSSILSTVTSPFRGASSDSPSRRKARSKERFDRFSQRQPDGQLGLNESSFVDAIAPEGEDYHKIKREQYAILFYVADRRRRGIVNYQDWTAFENLLAKPDAEYDIAFRLFDTEGSGSVSYDIFQKLFSGKQDGIPFNWNCDWATLYVGASRSRHGLDYTQFSQMLRGLTGERVRQAFHYFDKNKDGFIQPEEFQQIIVETAKHKLSDHLLENLHTIGNITRGSKITYSDVRAFQNIVTEMDMVRVIVRNATSRSSDGKITKEEFMEEAARVTSFSLFTPHEINILFHFAGLDSTGGRLSYGDFQRVLDPSWRESFRIAEDAAARAAELAKAAAARGTNYLAEILESMYHFAIGSIAGAFGATIVYPIDLVKTRMQNQRSTVVGQVLYTNSIDCARKVFRNEGPLGFYRGLLPQLVVLPSNIDIIIYRVLRLKKPLNSQLMTSYVQKLQNGKTERWRIHGRF
jgi:solute carrier family 25 (mitochondrial aspartate/glutamate transporter), member 12/13